MFVSPGELATGTTHGAKALSTWAMRSRQLLPPGAAARKNRCDSKASARPVPPSRKPRTGLAYGNPGGVPPRGTDCSGPGTELEEAGNAQCCAQAPPPRYQGQNMGETCSRGPGCITIMRWGWVLVPPPATEQTPKHKLEK